MLESIFSSVFYDPIGVGNDINTDLRNHKAF